MKYKRNVKKTIRLIIYILVSILSIAIDLFCFKEKTIPHISTLVITCFSSLISISGIWVGCYLLFLELFRDRYQFKLLKKNHYDAMKDIFFIVIYCILFGTIVMAVSTGIISSIIFCIISICTVAEILVKIFQSNKSIMVTTHIDKLEKELESKILSGKVLSFSELEDYKYLFDECIVKEEYYTIQNIVEKSGELFRTFLKNSIGASGLEESFNSILKFNCMQLDFCRTIKSELLIAKITKQQYLNLKFCIDNLQTEWYRRYLDKIKYYFTSPKDYSSKNQVSEDIFYHMHRVVLYLIKKKSDELAEYTIGEIQKYISAFKFTYKNVEIDNFALYNFFILNECKENGQDEWFVKISNAFIEFSDKTYVKDISFLPFRANFALIFSYYCQKDKHKALAFCEDTIKTFTYDINSTEFTAFKYSCISELYDMSENDEDFCEKVFNLHIEILNRSLSAQTKADAILLPKLDQVILTGKPVKDRYQNNLNEYKSLLNTCIIENETTHFYKFLNCINEVLIKTESRQKDIQIELLNIYLWAIHRSRNLANKNFYKISFELLEQAINDIDKQKNISDNLGKYIIEELSSFAKCLHSDNYEIINASIDLLRSFVEDGKTLYFIYSFPDRRKQLYRSLFNIGTNCIENNYEEGVRRISNTIGWSIISCIKQSAADYTKYLIDRAIDLYEISVQMQTSTTTQVFIVTLFTTIGAYCCKDQKLYTYRNRIIKQLTTPIETIETAARLRTKESDTWNDLFDNKTEILTNAFLDAYKEQHS